MMVLVVSALLAAIGYGVGAAVEQRQAALAPEAAAGRPRLLVALARKPLWLAGFGAQFGGFAAHAVALRYGPLAVVQMVVSGELLVSVLLVRRWARRPLSAGSWAAAITVVLGIAAFMALAGPPGHRHSHGIAAAAHHHAGRGETVLATLLLAAAIAVLLAAGLSAPGTGDSGRRRALLLALAAGLADSCSAVVTMAFARLAGHGLLALATTWPAYALVVVGVGNVLLTQTAYQAGRPMITLPVISAVTPLASVAIGIGLLGETPRLGTAGLAAAVVVAVVTGLALAFLARSSAAGDTASSDTVSGDTATDALGLALPRESQEQDDGGDGATRSGKAGPQRAGRVPGG